MPRAEGPNRSELGALLRHLSQATGQRSRDIAPVVGRDQSWVSRVWGGRAVPDRTQLGRWLALVDATPEQSEQAWRLFEAAHTETVTWRAKMRDGHAQHEGADRLAAARRVLAFEPWIIPGPLQTERTARAMLEGPDAAEGTDVDAAVAARMAMNGAALASARRFEVLLAEGLVDRVAREDRAQYARLRAADATGNVQVRVLPSGDGTEHPGIGFTVYDMGPDDGSVVVLELPHGQVEVAGPDEVAVYLTRWTGMWETSWELA